MADERNEILEPGHVEIHSSGSEVRMSLKGSEAVPVTALGNLPWWAALHLQAYAKRGLHMPGLTSPPTPDPEK